MGRIFRPKYMKWMAAWMAGVLFAGSMDAGMLSVQAAQENPPAVTVETENLASGRALFTEDEEEIPAGDMAAEVSADDGGAAGDDTTGGGTGADQTGTNQDNTETDGDGTESSGGDDSEPEKPAQSAQVEIVGGTIADHAYDGSAMTVEQLIPENISVSEKLQEGSTGGSIDKNTCDYYYRFSGTSAGGTAYDSGVPLSEEELTAKADFAGPKDAGSYLCTVSYAKKRNAEGDALDKIYATKEISFAITKKPIKIKAKDITVKKGAAIPEAGPDSYTYVGGGLASGDSLTTEPTITCNTGTDTPGTYEDVILIAGADAGPNYEITYEAGTLTVEEDSSGGDPEETGKKLVRIEEPDPVTGILNGTPLAEIELPGTVTIVTAVQGSAGKPEETEETASVIWDRTGFAEGTYDPESTEEQTFRLQGTVTLPKDVEADGVSLSVQIAVTVEAEAEVPKLYRLVRIAKPADVHGVRNGTPLDQIVLPEKVSIELQDIVEEGSTSYRRIEEASVDWDRTRTVGGTSYSPSNKNEQSFQIGGTVELPKEVDADGVSLDVTIQVYMREEITSTNSVLAPEASVLSGSRVQRGTTVELTCATEGAAIYYTLDDSTPTRQSNRYTQPIVLNVFTTVRAFAVMSGRPDSPVVKFTYSVITSSSSGNSQGESEVPKEDIPSDGKIPEGMWVPEMKTYVYTGKAIKPEVRVYDYTTLLVEKKDYTVSYKNNVNAASADAQKAPTITITGKGNYEGKLVKTFTIDRKNINDTDVSIDDITLLYNGKAQKPSPTVLWNGKKLSNKKDYTVQDVSYTDAGSRKITVTGNGNYKGERKFNFTIVADGVLVSKLTVSKIPDQPYTGKEIKPVLTVKDKGTVLGENLNYTVSYENNVQVGTATAVIKGSGKYAGTKKVTFKITPAASLSKARIAISFESQPVYTGREIRIDGESVEVTVKDESGQKVTRTLKRDTDYKVTYQNNTKAGKATVVFTGIGAYNGTAKKTFQISAYDIASSKVKINVNKSYPYRKGGCKAEPTVMFSGTQLKLGTDYTLSYKQNNAAGKEATMTIKGKGNFKGSTTKKYTVAAQDIGKVQLSAADKVYQNKKNIYKTTVRLTDSNGKALSAGKDYDKNFAYVYAADTRVHNARLNPDAPEEYVARRENETIDPDDVIPAGTTIKVTVTATGNDYTGTIAGTYRIATAGISGAKVTVPVQTYTGKAIEPSKSQITVTLKGETLSSDQYEILEYTNNINKGTAKMVIHGINGYGGTKTVSFKIKGKGIFG